MTDTAAVYTCNTVIEYYDYKVAHFSNDACGRTTISQLPN